MIGCNGLVVGVALTVSLAACGGASAGASRGAVLVARSDSGGEVVTRSYDAAQPRMREVCGKRRPEIVSIEPVVASTAWSSREQGKLRAQWQESLEASAPEGASETQVTMSTPSEEHAIRFRCAESAPAGASTTTVTAMP